MLTGSSYTSIAELRQLNKHNDLEPYEFDLAHFFFVYSFFTTNLMYHFETLIHLVGLDNFLIA